MPEAATTTVTPAAPQVPAKFVKDGKVDTGALVASYLELEKKQSATASTPATPSTTIAVPAPVSTSAAPPAVKGFAQYEKEFAEKGVLSPESYKALEDNGHNKAEVDDFIAFRQNKAATFENKVLEVVGGEKAYAPIATWAKGNLKPDEIAAFDSAINSGNEATASLAMRGLKSRYEEANGRDPTLVSGSAPTGGNRPFANATEAAKYINNPKFKTDPDYKADYYSRLKVSTY